MLSKEHFNVRAVVSDNHSTNVSAYKHLKDLYPCSLCDNAITNPYNPKKHIYLNFDTVHLIKNIRNKLFANKIFQMPALETTLMDVAINITPGPIHWAIFHRVHDIDLAIECRVRKAPKISYQVLHQEIINSPSLLLCQYSIWQPLQQFTNIFQKIKQLNHF